jgi:hypothetical protein
MNRDILDLLTKPTIPGNCGFPMTNLNKEPGVGFVPQSNSDNNPILFYICSGNTQPASLFFMIYPKLQVGKKTLLPLVLIQMKFSSNHHGF